MPLVAPTRAGLAALTLDMPEPAGEEPYPSILRETPERWLTAAEPPPAALASLTAQLRNYLGPQGYLLLQATAVYPAIAWNITAFLAGELLAGRERESLLARITVLPWFRHGRMPDWLRVRVLRGLGAKEEVVRAAVERYLAGPPATVHRKEEALEVVPGTPHAEGRRHASAALEDHVYLAFAGRKPLNQLAVRAPRGWRKLVLHTAWVRIAAAVLCLVALWFLTPKVLENLAGRQESKRTARPQAVHEPTPFIANLMEVAEASEGKGKLDLYAAGEVAADLTGTFSPLSARDVPVELTGRSPGHESANPQPGMIAVQGDDLKLIKSVERGEALTYGSTTWVPEQSLGKVLDVTMTAPRIVKLLPDTCSATALYLHDLPHEQKKPFVVEVFATGHMMLLSDDENSIPGAALCMYEATIEPARDHGEPVEWRGALRFPLESLISPARAPTLSDGENELRKLQEAHKTLLKLGAAKVKISNEHQKAFLQLRHDYDEAVAAQAQKNTAAKQVAGLAPPPKAVTIPAPPNPINLEVRAAPKPLLDTTLNQPPGTSSRTSAVAQGSPDAPIRRGTSAASTVSLGIPDPPAGPPVKPVDLGTEVSVSGVNFATLAATSQTGCAQGRAQDCDELGFLYLNGRGLAKDETNARLAYDKACDGKVADACYQMGQIYLRGLAVTVDAPHAGRYFDQACNLYDTRACKLIGRQSTEPKLVYKAKPQYTQEARKLHIEGAVLLNVVVDVKGQTTVSSIETSLGHGLDEAAVDAAKKTRFDPARDNTGRPIAWTGKIRIDFQLADTAYLP